MSRCTLQMHRTCPLQRKGDVGGKVGLIQDSKQTIQDFEVFCQSINHSISMGTQEISP